MIDAAFTEMIIPGLAVLHEQNQTDPVSLDLKWSEGSIAPETEEEQRAAVLEQSDPGRGAFAVRKAYENLMDIKERLKNREQLRIWYSYASDDLCGLYWLCHEIAGLVSNGQVLLVKLPDFLLDAEGGVVQCNGWKEMDPALWARYVPFSMPASAQMIQAMAKIWENLQKENGDYREEIGGIVRSFPASIVETIRENCSSQPE